MGSTMAICRSECAQHCEELNGRRLYSSSENSSSNSFSAEVYRLSEDKRQWIKMHPKMLCLRLKQQCGDGQQKGISRLEVTTLEEQQKERMDTMAASIDANGDSKAAIMSIPIPQGTHLKRYTDKFVYWRHNQSQQIFGLSLSSSADLDRFCSSVQCLPPTPFLNPNMESKDKTNVGPSTQLRAIMLELVGSERTFVQDLQKLLANFVLPSGLQFMQCVRQLHRAHSLFLAALESMLAPALSGKYAMEMDYGELKPLLIRLFGLFIAKCSQFKVYSEFTFAHMHFQQLRKKNGAFAELIAASAAPIGGISSLDSLLIKPVQRLLKYPLFLAQFRELCAEGSEERTLCVKALKQMRTLANWLNEMQRIQEDYGPQLLAIPLESISSSSTNCHLADLSSLQLFAHVRFLNPPQFASNCSSASIQSINCALFAFHSAVVILERKNKEETAKQLSNKKLLPLVLPISQIQLLVQQKAENPSATPIQNGCYAQFALAHRTQANLHDSTKSSSTLSQRPFIRLYHFECCHPEVCRHLALAVGRRKTGNGEEQRSEEHGMAAMMVSWRMDGSIDSNCSDRGYLSGESGAEQPMK